MNFALAEILISNIIKNAIFHTFKSGKIKLTITNQEFTIANTGSETKLDSQLIFNRFEKDQAQTKSTGLGLAICKAICKSNGMEISYLFINEMHVFRVKF